MKTSVRTFPVKNLNVGHTRMKGLCVRGRRPYVNINESVCQSDKRLSGETETGH